MELRQVCKAYGRDVITPVLFEVDLALEAGEFVAILGASGSGKTTLLNLAGLLDSPTEGRIFLKGQDVSLLTDDEKAYLRRDYLGFIFQFHYLLPAFSVLENALMPCRIKGREAEDQARERMVALLKRVGLGERLHYKPAQLSGGQQQRTAIIRALANDPALVLADEPTGNLDSVSGREVFNLMRELNRATGKAFLIVTHDRTFAREADRVLFLKDGRFIEKE
jgi:ABC-type lipoprotein export system ATPase subunit